MLLETDKMKITSFILSVFCFLSIQAQHSLLILSSKDNQPIPFAHVQIEKSPQVFASNKKGVLKLKGVKKHQKITFSAIGYDSKVLNYSTDLKEVKLDPLVFGLKEVVIKAEKHKKRIVGDHRRKSNRSFALGEVGNEVKIARFFDYQAIYQETPFIQQLQVMTTSSIWKAEFEVNFYGLDSLMCPSIPIFKNWITVQTKWGKTKNKIKLDSTFAFPKEGIYVVVRLINKEENKHEYTYTQTGSNKKYTAVSYEPSLCLVPVEKGNYYMQAAGRDYWRQSTKFNRSEYGLKESKYYQDKAVVPAITLILSN